MECNYTFSVHLTDDTISTGHLIYSISHLPIKYPIVTSSGSPMRSLIVKSFLFRMTGAIFNASGRLMQKPAPPVANQN